MTTDTNPPPTGEAIPQESDSQRRQRREHGTRRDIAEDVERPDLAAQHLKEVK